MVKLFLLEGLLSASWIDIWHLLRIPVPHCWNCLEDLQQSPTFSEWTRLGNVPHIHKCIVEKHTFIFYWTDHFIFKKFNCFGKDPDQEVYKLKICKVQVYFCLVISVESVSPKSLYWITNPVCWWMLQYLSSLNSELHSYTIWEESSVPTIFLFLFFFKSCNNYENYVTTLRLIYVAQSKYYYEV